MKDTFWTFAKYYLTQNLQARLTIRNAPIDNERVVGDVTKPAVAGSTRLKLGNFEEKRVFASNADSLSSSTIAFSSYRTHQFWRIG